MKENDKTLLKEQNQRYLLNPNFETDYLYSV